MARRGGRSKTSDFIERLVAIGTQTLVADMGLSDDVARTSMREIAHNLCREWGGSDLYVPQDMEFELTRRDLQIWERFLGYNHDELARDFGLTPRQIRNIVKHVRQAELRKRQGQLPGFDEPTAA